MIISGGCSGGRQCGSTHGQTGRGRTIKKRRCKNARMPHNSITRDDSERLWAFHSFSMFAYNWPVEGWMKPDAHNGGGIAPFSEAEGADVVLQICSEMAAFQWKAVLKSGHFSRNLQ